MRTPFQFTVYYLWKATIARRTAAIMYTNIWQRFCVLYQTKTGDTRQSPSLCWGASWDSLEEIPHAHADLVQSFLHAVVVPILFLFFVIFLKLLWERVVPPSGFLVWRPLPVTVRRMPDGRRQRSSSPSTALSSRPRPGTGSRCRRCPSPRPI